MLRGHAALCAEVPATAHAAGVGDAVQGKGERRERG